MYIVEKTTKTTYTDRTFYDNLLGQIKEAREFTKVIEKRKTKSSGHFINHNIFIGNTFEGKLLMKKEEADRRRDIWTT